MAQFIALLRRDYDRFTEADFAPLLEPEADRARALHMAGVFRQLWSRQDVPGATVLIEAPSLEAVREALDSLPLFAKAMLILEALVPLGPYRGFAPRG
jgi:muconolactone delta-isomerase